MRCIKNKKVAILRKDFLSSAEDIAVSYYCADVVLLIASVLLYENSYLMMKEALKLACQFYMK